MKKKSSLLSALIVCSLLTFACNKQNESAKLLKPETAHPLFEYAKDNISSFITIDIHSDAYQNYVKSNWGNNSNKFIKEMATESLGGAQTKSITDIFALSDKLQNSLNKDVHSIAGFIPSNGKELEAYIIVRANSENNRKEFLNLMEAELAKAKFEISNESEALKKIKSNDSDNEIFYTTIKEKDLLIATNKDLISNIQNNSEKKDFKLSIFEDSDYKKMMENLNVSKNNYLLGYADLNQLNSADLIDKASEVAGSNIDNSQIKDLPIKSIAFTSSMGDAPKATLLASINQQNSEGKKFASNLVNLTSLAGISNLPSDSFFTLGLNLNFLIKWAQELDPSIDFSTMGIDKADMNSIESLSLAVSPTAPGSMFPSLAILLNSANCNKFYDLIKNQIGGAAKTQMGAELNWLKKKLGSNEIEYIITPFGVGAYLSKDGNNCWVSSSEASFNSIYAVNGGKQLKDTLSKDQVNKLKDNSSLFFMNLNFVDLAKVIEEISGSLAMFTGGQAPLETKELEAIKKFGRLEASLAVKDSIIRFDSGYGKVS